MILSFAKESHSYLIIVEKIHSTFFLLHFILKAQHDIENNNNEISFS